MPGLPCRLGTRCEQPVSSFAGCVLTRGFAEQRKQSSYMFEKVVTNTLYWKAARWQINCEQCCTSEGVILKSQCWPRMCATSSAVHLLPVAQSWECQRSASWLLRHTTFAWLDYSPCLVQVHFSGFAVVEWAQTSPYPPTMFLCCSSFVL